MRGVLVQAAPVAADLDGVQATHQRTQRRSPRQRIGEFEVLEVLSRGELAVVRLVLHVPTNTRFVIKQFSVANPASARHGRNEVRVLRRIAAHGNVVAMTKVIASPSKLFAVLEHATGGDLAELVAFHHHEGLPTPMVRLYFRQLVAAVAHVHSQGFVHRDIKAENCLLTDSQQRLVLCDFGFACEADHRLEFVVTPQGTLPYAAPELLLQSVTDPFKIDVWSCGVLLYRLCTGAFPFEGNTPEQLVQQATEGALGFPESLGDAAKDLLGCMLQPVPSQRIAMGELASHPFVLSG